MQQLLDIIENSIHHNKEYYNLVFNRIFFFSKKKIISFPRILCLKLSDMENEEGIIVKCTEDYHFKMNSYEISYTHDNMASFKYLGQKKDIVIEPEYHTLSNLRKIFINRDPIIGGKIFKEWKTYFTYEGELKENEDEDVIIWEEPGLKYFFNKNLISEL